MNELTSFSQQGRKGIAYDWQSLYDPETSATLQELDREIERGLDFAFAE